MAESVQPGDTVLYTPDECHALDTDGRGGLLFEFAHHCPKEGSRTCRDGQRVFTVADGETVSQALLALGFQRAPDGQLQTRNGDYPIRAVRPKAPWPAVVLAVHADGTADLDVAHPDGSRRGCPRVPAGAPGESHTWHPKGD